MPPLPAPPKGNHQKMIEQIYETVLLDDISASSCLMVGGGGGVFGSRYPQSIIWTSCMGPCLG